MSRQRSQYAYILPPRSRGTRKSAAPRLEVSAACEIVLRQSSLRARRLSLPLPPLAARVPPGSTPLPTFTNIYCVFSFFFASKNRLEIDTSKKCSKGAILRHTWFPGAPEGDFLRHPGVRNLQNMVFYLGKTLISIKSTNPNFGSLLAPFWLQGLPHGAQGCPRRPKGSQKGIPFWSHFSHNFRFLGHSGARRAWKVATGSPASQNDAKTIKK